MSQITILVAPRRHPASQRLTRCQADATAATLGLGLGQPVRLLCAGTMPDAVARDYLALGAPVLEVLQAPPEAPLVDVLLPALCSADLVLTGTRAEADQATGMLPYALAAALGWPVVTDVLQVEANGSGWTLTQALPKGARRRLNITTPAVLAISAAAPVTLRHSLADAMAGQIVRTPAAAVAHAMPVGKRVASRKRRQVLEAKTVQSGHARMLGAIDTPSTGGVVLHTGSADSKAQAVLDYLRTHSLVTF